MFDSYIVSNTKTSLSMSLAYPPQKELKHSKDFKRFAFTLAETLITLTIIGVVAALTVPTLLNKYTKHTYVVGLKKAYAQLQHAVKMIPITEGCSAGDYDCAGMFQGGYWLPNGQYVNIPVTNIDEMDFKGDLYHKQAYLFSKQFKIHKFCERSNKERECAFAKNYDGSSVVFKTNDGMCYIYGTGSIGVDINCEKGPNKAGRDHFTFEIAYESRNNIPQGTILPFGSKLMATFANEDYYYWYASSNGILKDCGSINQVICTGRVLEEDAMNY